MIADDKLKVTIVFEGSERSCSFVFTEDYDVQWTKLLQHFVDSLQGYGFVGVQDRVSVEDGLFVDEYWQGPVHEASE